MKKKEAINNLLKFLFEETKKLKNKKQSGVAAPIAKRYFNSFNKERDFMADSDKLNENRAIIKPISKKFDHLKWKLNDYQKSFLSEFIEVPDESLKKEDYEYASKRTGIPIENIKSIKNTLSDKKTAEQIYNEQIKIQKELGLGGGDERLTKQIEQEAVRQMTDVRNLPKDKAGKTWSMNPHPEFRNKTQHQIDYEKELASKTGGGLSRRYERELPNFMYEWLMYFIEGSETGKITESKLMNDLHSTMFDKYKFILFSFDTQLKESGAHPYDLASNNKVKELTEFYDKIKEFNDTFGTNFIIANQYTGDDGMTKIVLENSQVTDGKRVFNKKLIDMSNTDEKRMEFFNSFKSIYG